MIIELVVSPVNGNTAYNLGWLAATMPVSRRIASDLKRLTGFDVIIIDAGRVIGHSRSPLSDSLVINHKALKNYGESGHGISQVNIDGEEIILYHAGSEQMTGQVIFAASLDRHVAPIRKKVILALVLL